MLRDAEDFIHRVFIFKRNETEASRISRETINLYNAPRNIAPLGEIRLKILYQKCQKGEH